MSKELKKNVANNVANTNSQHLTEQWRNGTLPFGMYYVKSTYGDIRTDETVYLVGKKRFRWRYTDICCLEEVLAPVPDYVDYKEFEHTRECLKLSRDKVIRLQEQLNEANEVIKKYRRFEVSLKVEKGTLTGVYPAVDYLKKWGVK